MCLDFEYRTSVFACNGGIDLASEFFGEVLRPVADAEKRNFTLLTENGLPDRMMPFTLPSSAGILL